MRRQAHRQEGQKEGGRERERRERRTRPIANPRGETHVASGCLDAIAAGCTPEVVPGSSKPNTKLAVSPGRCIANGSTETYGVNGANRSA
eukprot:790430-Rhodomonas_salina.6